MEFSLTEDQGMIRDSVRRFMAERYTRERWGEVAAQQGFREENWKEMAELGYLAIGQPESYGGSGGPVELAVICEEFGRGLLLEPFIGTSVFAAKLIAAAGSPEQQAALLAAIMQGEKIVSVAHSEAGSGAGLKDIATTARQNGDSYVLSGRKSLVLAGPAADLLIVSARGEQAGEPSLFIVDPEQPGVRLTPAPMLDRTWCADVELKDVKVKAANLLGHPGSASGALNEALRYANLAVCAEMVGIIDRALEIAVEYTKTRQQFGASISTFQALRHKVADLAIDREMARSMLVILIASFQDPERYEPTMTAAMAKAHLAEIGRRVCAQAIQLHGAMGMTDECGVGRYFARANVISSLFGRADQQLQAYATLLAEHIKSRSTGDDGVSC